MAEQKQQFKVGDLVTPKTAFAQAGLVGKVFRVVKVNPKNLKCTPVDGVGRGLNYPAYALDPHDPTATSASLAAAALKTIPMPLLEGTIVTLARPWKHVGTDVPFVVTKDNGERTSIAPLGGGLDVPALRIARGGVVERDLAWLTTRLREMAVSA